MLLQLKNIKSHNTTVNNDNVIKEMLLQLKTKKYKIA
jgi:hypothetical protein